MAYTPSALDILSALQMMREPDNNAVGTTSPMEESGVSNQVDPVDKDALASLLGSPSIQGVLRAAPRPALLKGKTSPQANSNVQRMQNGISSYAATPQAHGVGNYPPLPGRDTFSMDPTQAGWSRPIFDVPAGGSHDIGYEAPDPATFSGLSNNDLMDPASISGFVPVADAAKVDRQSLIHLLQPSHPPQTAINNTNIFNPVTPAPTTGAGSGLGSMGIAAGNSYRHSQANNDYTNITNAPPINAASYQEAAKNIGAAGGIDIPKIQQQEYHFDANLNKQISDGYYEERHNSGPITDASALSANIGRAARQDSTTQVNQIADDYYAAKVKPFIDNMESHFKGIGKGSYFPSGVAGDIYNRYVVPSGSTDTKKWMIDLGTRAAHGDPTAIADMNSVQRSFAHYHDLIDKASNNNQLVGTGKKSAAERTKLHTALDEFQKALINK